MIYLDNAATTPLAEEVLEAMLPYMREEYGNPSSIHQKGRATRNAIEQARKVIASQLNASPSEIFFTSGGTETNNFAIKCTVRDHAINHVITSKIEHHCVLHTVEDLEKRGTQVHWVKLTDHGHVDLEHLDQLLAEIGEKTLVSLMHANNEIGNLLDLDRAGEICKKHDAIFHSDSVQSMCHYEIDVQKTWVHMLSGSAHKFHGPKGTGFIYLRGGHNLEPFIHGGSQERNMRAGTESVHGIVGLGKAFELAYANLEADRAHMQGLKDHMISRFRDTIEGVDFNGDYEGANLFTVLSVSFPPNDRSEMMLFNMDIEGICVSSGSACSSGSESNSHVLTEIGADLTRPAVRFSFSKHNTKEEINEVVDKVLSLISAEPVS
jgi:cysteine desulfurase